MAKNTKKLSKELRKIRRTFNDGYTLLRITKSSDRKQENVTRIINTEPSKKQLPPLSFNLITRIIPKDEGFIEKLIFDFSEEVLYSTKWMQFTRKQVWEAHIKEKEIPFPVADLEFIPENTAKFPNKFLIKKQNRSYAANLEKVIDSCQELVDSIDKIARCRSADISKITLCGLRYFNKPFSTYCTEYNEQIPCEYFNPVYEFNPAEKEDGQLSFFKKWIRMMYFKMGFFKKMNFKRLTHPMTDYLGTNRPIPQVYLSEKQQEREKKVIRIPYSIKPVPIFENLTK